MSAPRQRGGWEGGGREARVVVVAGGGAGGLAGGRRVARHVRVVAGQRGRGRVAGARVRGRRVGGQRPVPGRARRRAGRVDGRVDGRVGRGRGQQARAGGVAGGCGGERARRVPAPGLGLHVLGGVCLLLLLPELGHGGQLVEAGGVVEAHLVQGVHDHAGGHPRLPHRGLRLDGEVQRGLGLHGVDLHVQRPAPAPAPAVLQAVAVHAVCCQVFSPVLVCYIMLYLIYMVIF